MIFLTVGTEYPFDRLVRTVDLLVEENRISAEIFAQIGFGSYVPKHFDHTEMLSREGFDASLNQCQGVISHAGMGTIIQSLLHNKPIVIMPRRKDYSEILSDHQRSTARSFSGRKGVIVANDELELGECIMSLDKEVTTDSIHGSQLIVDRIRQFLADECRTPPDSPGGYKTKR